MAVSDKPWAQFTQADYTPEQWRRACLVDTGDGAADAKQRYKVPVREPDGTLNRNGVHAAAGGHGLGAVAGIPAAARQSAARKLVAMYRDDLNEDPPASLMQMAGMMGGRSGRESMSDLERRFTAVPVEVRRSGSQERIGGYAAMFSRTSRNLGGFVELVTTSAFNRSRADGWPEVMARYNHDDNMLLGTTGGGTLHLQIDETGLFYEVNPPASRADIVELVSRGDVRKSSFAFYVPNGGDEWALNEQGFPMRSLLSVELVDVAPVNAPAYTDTSAGIRSLARRMEADVEEVRSLAQKDELRKFFARTDTKGRPVKPAKPKTFGPAAAAALLARKTDPWGE